MPFNPFSEPWDVTWRTALVRLPRLVPHHVLMLTAPDVRYTVANLPSRGQYKIPVYIFVPPSLDATRVKELPVLLDFHGGGFFLGSCLEQAPFCGMMAKELECVAISVDYRMGPVDKFPAAIEDAEEILRAILVESAPAYKELREAISQRVTSNAGEAARKAGRSNEHCEDMVAGLDKSRIAVSGFSSGGNIALNLALSVTGQQEGAPWPSVFPKDYKFDIPLLLYYPSLDATMLPSERTAPPAAPVSKSWWSQTNDVLQPTYLPREQAAHPRASPGLADLNGLHSKARMLLVLPEIDSLAEQSDIWVKKASTGGREGDLKVVRFPGMKHGWTQMPESWLGVEEKRTRKSIFEDTVTFTRAAWDRQKEQSNG